MGEPVPEMRVRCHNDIPTARGLGSSSAALVGGLMAGSALNGDPLSRSDLLQIAARVEGHPDNVAPAIYGGMRIAALENGVVTSAPVPVPPELSAVLYVPSVAMPTDEARGLLGAEVSRADAVFNIARAALLVRAMATGDLRHLRIATGRQASPAGAADDILPDEEHHPRGAGRGRAWGVPVRRRFDRLGFRRRKGVHHRLRNGGRRRQIRAGRRNPHRQANGAWGACG